MADEQYTAIHGTHGNHLSYLLLGLLAIAAFAVGAVSSGAAVLVFLLGGLGACIMAFSLLWTEKAQARTFARQRYEPPGDRLPGLYVPPGNALNMAQHTPAENPVLRAARQGTPRGIWGR